MKACRGMRSRWAFASIARGVRSSRPSSLAEGSKCRARAAPAAVDLERPPKCLTVGAALGALAGSAAGGLAVSLFLSELPLATRGGRCPS